MLKYVPREIYKGSVILFKAKHILPEYKEIDELTNHWQSYVMKPIKVHYISGNHGTILHVDGAKEIAEIMGNYVISHQVD